MNLAIITGFGLGLLGIALGMLGPQAPQIMISGAILFGASTIALTIESNRN